MAEEEMSKQLQDQVNRLQQLRLQLQMLMQQRQQVELRLKEVEEALDELDKTDTKTPVYKSVGSILIKTSTSPICPTNRRRRDNRGNGDGDYIPPPKGEPGQEIHSGL